MNMGANTKVIGSLKQNAMIVNVNTVTVAITIMKLSISGMLLSLSRLTLSERMPERTGSVTGTPINNTQVFPKCNPPSSNNPPHSI